MIIISLKNNSKYAQIVEQKFAKKKKRKERKIIALLPKILHIVPHGKLEKLMNMYSMLKKNQTCK